MKNNKGNKWMSLSLWLIALIIISVVAYFIVDTLNDENINNKELSDVVVAEYGLGNKITMSQLNKDYSLYLFSRGLEQYNFPKTLILNQTIIEKLMVKDALKHGINVSDELVDSSILNSLKSVNSSKLELESALKVRNLTYADFFSYKRRDLIIGLFLRENLYKDVDASKDEIREYYETHKSDYVVPEEREFSHILVNSSSDAERLIRQLNNGADFSNLAKKYSLDNYSSSLGGKLGFHKKGDLVPEFEKVAYNLKTIGQISQKPVKTRFGYHIIKLDGVKESYQNGLSSVRKEIRYKITDDKRRSILKQYLNTLMKNSNVKVYLRAKKMVLNNVSLSNGTDLVKV